MESPFEANARARADRRAEVPPASAWNRAAVAPIAVAPWDGHSARVLDLDEGDADVRLLGVKAAGLRELTRLGLPTPPGFTVTCAASGSLLPAGALPEGLASEIEPHVRRLEIRAGRAFGDPHDPLLLSVRTGCASAGVELMETILNVGLNDQSVRGLAARVGDEHFAFACYARLIADYAVQVMGLPGPPFSAARDRAARAAAAQGDGNAQRERELVGELKSLVLTGAGREFPQDPRAQLLGALAAALASRRRGPSPEPDADGVSNAPDVAITVMEMVFGNASGGSGTGLVIRRGPAGEQKLSGAFLAGVQGDDLLSQYRARGGEDLSALVPPTVLTALQRAVEVLDQAGLAFAELEFTVEAGRLWLLQMHPPQPSSAAASPGSSATPCREEDRDD